MKSNNAEVLVAAALAGQGILLFPSWLFSPASFKEESLINLLPEWKLSASAEGMYVQLLSPQNRLRSRKVREYQHFVEGNWAPSILGTSVARDWRPSVLSLC